MPHFHVLPQNVVEGRFFLAAAESHHVATVLRRRPGDEIRLFDGEGRSYRAVIDSAEDARVAGRILEDEVLAPDPWTLRLFQGLPKGDKMEWIVEKAAELGVSDVVPVAAERCVTRLDAARASSRLERWRKVARAAEKQSGRWRPMTVSPVLGWGAALERCAPGETILLPWEGESARSLATALSPLREQSSPVLNVFIGPEGGLTPEEVDQARRRGAVTVTLGPRILRTETAALYIAAVVHHEFLKG